MAFLESVKKFGQQHGWRYSFAIAFNRVVPAWLFRYRTFVVYQLDADKSCSQGATTAEANVVAPDSSTDPDAKGSQPQLLHCQQEADCRAVEQLTYFRQADTIGETEAYAAKVDGDLAAGIWVASHLFDERELGIRLQLDDSQAWLFAALVDKKFRRQGIYGRLLPFVMQDLSLQGFEQQLVAVNPANIASNRAHQRLASRTVGYVSVARLFRTSVCWTRGDIRSDRLIGWNSKRDPVMVSFPTK